MMTNAATFDPVSLVWIGGFQSIPLENGDTRYEYSFNCSMISADIAERIKQLLPDDMNEKVKTSVKNGKVLIVIDKDLDLDSQKLITRAVKKAAASINN